MTGEHLAAPDPIRGPAPQHAPRAPHAHAPCIRMCIECASASPHMRRFAELFRALDETTRVNPKVDAMEAYFREADPADKLWTVALLSGRRPKRTVNATRLREWAAERAGIPLWLFEEAYPIVGDLAETISLVLPAPGLASKTGP